MSDKNKWLINLSDEVLARLGDQEFETLSRPEQVFVCIWELEADVNNGGFDQYFFNGGGDHAQTAPEALAAIGAHSMKRIVEAALTVFGADGPPRDRNLRQSALEALSEDQATRLDELSQAFWAYPDDLTERLYDFVTQNIGDIRGASEQ